MERDLQALLQQHPEHPFVLIHMGQLTPDKAAKLIAAHPNVYFMTSRADPIDLARSHGKQPWQNMFNANDLKPRWKELLATHADRFIFAMDNHIAEGHWNSRDYPRRVPLWREALDTLPITAADAIAHGNAERLWKLPRAE
jgi:predicted TIM-barrel fold metal-dependent hydrolase